MTEVLLVEERGDVDWVTMNRPESLNALNPDLVEALATYFESLYRRHDRRIVVLQGAGRGYCSGLDLSKGRLTGNGPGRRLYRPEWRRSDGLATFTAPCDDARSQSSH